MNPDSNLFSLLNKTQFASGGKKSLHLRLQRLGAAVDVRCGRILRRLAPRSAPLRSLALPLVGAASSGQAALLQRHLFSSSRSHCTIGFTVKETAVLAAWIRQSTGVLLNTGANNGGNKNQLAAIAVTCCKKLFTSMGMSVFHSACEDGA